MSTSKHHISSELSGPDLRELASLQQYCGQDCSPEQVSHIYENTIKSIPVFILYEPRTTTSPQISLPRTDDPKPLFGMQVRCAIAEEPVEAGYPHPAETILAKAVINQPRNVFTWLEYLLADEKNHSLLGDILMCFAYAVGKNPPIWAYGIAEKALRHSSVGVRDSAAQVLEFWGTPNAVDILKNHDESIRWLKDYIEEVIDLLETA
ncbi:MAG: hypothetical protein ACLQPD_34620 [Desulfomonilaceae bacterium]